MQSPSALYSSISYFLVFDIYSSFLQSLPKTMGMYHGMVYYNRMHVKTR